MMEFLKDVPKNDLISLLQIGYEATIARNKDQLQKCFDKIKSLIFFEGAFLIYTEKEVLSKKKDPKYFYHSLDLHVGFINEYVKGCYYANSLVVQSVFETWMPQHWKTVWNNVNQNTDAAKAMRLAVDYGYLDGWACANCHPKNATLSFYVFAGKKVDFDSRTAAILRYITPYFSESLKAIFHEPLVGIKERERAKITGRELEVLKWIVEGKSTWEISVILNRSERVIKWHINNIMRKLSALNRTHAATIALRQKIIS